MPTSREWLKLFRRTGQDTEWFRSQSEVLYDNIKRGLHVPSERSGFMQVLIHTLPFLPTEYRLSRWLELAHDAVDVTYDLRDVQERSTALNEIGAFQLFLNDAEEAEVTFSLASDIANAIQDRKGQIRALIGYLWLQAQVKPMGYTYAHLPEILMYNGADRDQELSARLYQVVGALCNQFEQHDRAVSYSRFAYSYWKTNRNLGEMGRTAYTLAVAYREQQELEIADYYLDHAADLYAKTNYVWQHSGITYERGVHYYLQGDYDAALQWLQMSWEEVQQLDDPHRQQRVQHCMGIVLSRFKNRLDESRGYLNNALKIAEAQDSKNDVIHIRHSLAFNTARQGDYETAKNEIRYGLQITESIRDEGKRQSMRDLFEELLDMIDHDDPRLRE